MNAPRFVAGSLAVLLTFLVAALGGAPPATKSAPKSAPKTTAKSKSRQRRAVVYRPVQRVPTPERIKEIQQALAGRGYETPVDGQWGKDSMAAMARFQKDQHLENTGKLTSLSLIALGLGPKHVTAPPGPGPEKE